MSVRIFTKATDIDAYSSCAPHPLQSWQWGEARREMGTEVIRIGEYQEDNLVNVFQCTFHPIPKTPFQIMYLPRSVVPSVEVMRYLITVAREHNAVFIKCEPNEEKQGGYSFESQYRDLSYRVVLSSHPLFPRWTQVLDLTPSEEELLKNMKSKTRYNTRLAQKKGVTVTEQSDDEGFEIFTRLYFETCKRQKYYGHNEAYHRTVWNMLKKDIAHILIAWYQDEPLAAYELFLFNNKLYYPYGGSSVKYKNVMAANLIMWEAIRFGKKQGATSFDMWGSTGPEYETDDSYAGFTRFKEGYGTRFVEMIGSYDIILKPALYALYSQVYHVRNWWLSR